MSRSKFLILLGLVLLMTIPFSIANAQSVEFPGSGTAIISDGTSKSDRLTYNMTGMRRLSAERIYEGWLVNSSTGDLVSTGVMRVNTRGGIARSWTSPTGENLIENYDTVVISVESVPDPDPDEPSDIKPFANSVPLSAMTHIRHLLVSWPAGDATGILSDLRTQLDVAIQHVRLARSATDLTGLRQHTHHVINIVEGEDGPNFDASFGNPGDGMGVLLHAQDRKHATFAADTVPGNLVIKTHAQLVEEYGENAEMWSAEARDSAVDVLDEDSLTIAKTLLNLVEGRLVAARSGIPALPDEGGAQQAYLEAQRMATFTLPAPLNVGTPSVGDASVPLMMQMALAGALVLLASGGFLLYRERRAKAINA